MESDILDSTFFRGRNDAVAAPPKKLVKMLTTCKER